MANNLPEERWLPIKGFDGFYEVSDQGHFRSVDRMIFRGRGVRLTPGQPLRLGRQRGGYAVVTFCVDSVHSSYTAHRIVLETFVGPKPPGMECRHLDGNRLNNALTNLCWGTKAENMADRDQHGGTMAGERNGSAKLTDQTAAQVIDLLAEGRKHREIAEQFGVSPAAIWMIATGRKWKHLPRPAEVG